MTPKLYMTDLSPSVRAVLLTAKAIGLTLKCKTMNYFKGEPLITEFQKNYLQHPVPTLVDNGFVVWDSHAILAYLVGKYGTDTSLYPSDLYIREIIDERLHFESDILKNVIQNIFCSLLCKNIKGIPKEEISAINEAYALVEKFLEREWVAGSNITIADFSLIPTITSLDVLVPIDSYKFPKVNAWLNRAQLWPFYNEANQVGLIHFREFYENLKI